MSLAVHGPVRRGYCPWIDGIARNATIPAITAAEACGAVYKATTHIEGASAGRNQHANWACCRAGRAIRTAGSVARQFNSSQQPKPLTRPHSGLAIKSTAL